MCARLPRRREQARPPRITSLRFLYAPIRRALWLATRETAQYAVTCSRREADRPRYETHVRAFALTYAVDSDGRCMFRAISQGIAMGKGRGLFAAEEERQADLLRMACAEAICASAERREKFPEALVAIKSEDELPSYCKRIVEPSFWGGEAELLVISRMLKQPIKVYMKNKKLGGPPFRSIQEYGMDYANPRTLKSGKVAPGKPAVKLLYNGSSHYELLVKRGRL